MELSLKEKRMLFTQCVVLLIKRMTESGFKPCLGKDGLKHMKNSLHYDGLAVDIDLYDGDGVYLSTTDAHRDFGMYWEGLHELCFWGGNGLKQDGLYHDGNHYAVTDSGRK